MTTVIAIGAFVLLFALFPFLARERGGGDCGGCEIRKTVGTGCGRCDTDNPRPE